MKLYYSPGACSLADHIALIEAGLPYELVKVDLKAKQTEDGGDYEAVNPKGYVPALALDDGGVLTENIAVLSYIAERSGSLMPSGGLQRIRVLEATAFVSTELHKNFKPFFNPAASEAEKDEAGALLGKRFGAVDAMLDDRGFLLGDEPTIADCYLFVMLIWAKKNELHLPERLRGFFERFRHRPSVGRAMTEEGLAIA